MKYYKFLTATNRGPYSDFDFTDWLAGGDHSGEWLPAIENLEECERGYHACTQSQLIRWLDAVLYEVEYSEEPEFYDAKVNGRSIRFVRRVDTWNDRTARLFAVWCAREALKLVYNPDPRSIAACDVAEKYANGEATDEELDAAWDAARSAAWSAAESAAWSAARDAASYAAWYTAQSAAMSAQNAKLVEMLGLDGPK